MECVQQELFGRSISGEALFNINAPQYKALEWLVYKNEPIYSTEMTVMRYILAVLFYSTNGDGWKWKGRFLSTLGVCNWRFVICTSGGYHIRKFLGISHDCYRFRMLLTCRLLVFKESKATG